MLLNRLVSALGNEVRPWLACRDRKSISTQAREVRKLWRKYEILPYHYLKHHLFSRAAGPIDDYISPEIIRRFQIASNPPEALDLLADKLQTNAVLSAHGIPCIQEIFSIDRDGVITSPSGEVVSVEQAVAILQARAGNVFLKPVWMGVGQGAEIAPASSVTAEKLRALRWYLVQPFVTNHPDIGRLHPPSLNTVRVDTYVEGSQCFVTAACLKIGTGGAPNDNWASGSIAIGIDLETGRLFPHGFKKAKFGRGPYARHPDTGHPFSGVTLPYWPETLSMARRAALSLRPNACIGWDLAITPDGPIVVEGNETGDFFLLQEACGPLGATVMGKSAAAFHKSGAWKAGWGDPHRHLRLDLAKRAQDGEGAPAGGSRE